MAGTIRLDEAIAVWARSCRASVMRTSGGGGHCHAVKPLAGLVGVSEGLTWRVYQLPPVYIALHHKPRYNDHKTGPGEIPGGSSDRQSVG